MQKTVAIIPARYGSTRFPGKALADLGGKPLIRHVYERVKRASSLDDVVVATDDRRIADAITAFGGRVVMTSPDHQSGTDRVAEAARHLDADIVVNVQGDEPLIDPSLIDSLVEKLASDQGILCSTAAFETDDKSLYRDPNAVKVTADMTGRALYFSRAPIPCYRDSTSGRCFIHVGIYCFYREFLCTFAGLEPSALERAERLEQLRILENGYRIGVVFTGHPSAGVDTPEDLERVRRIMEK